MRRIVGLGAGGHAQVVIDLLRSLGTYDIVGLVERTGATANDGFAGVPIVGTDEDLARIRRDGVDAAFVGVGSSGDARTRCRLFDAGRHAGFEMIAATHPTAFISGSARIGSGVVVLAHAVVNAGAAVGDNVIVNTGAIVEHGCVIGSHVHIATGACLAGEVRVGAGAHIGIGASIVQGVRVGRNATIGAGAVVLTDVADDVVVVGVPARELKRKEYAWPI